MDRNLLQLFLQSVNFAAILWLVAGFFGAFGSSPIRFASVPVHLVVVAAAIFFFHKDEAKRRRECKAREAAYWASDDCLPIAEEIEEEPIPPVLSI